MSRQRYSILVLATVCACSSAPDATLRPNASPLSRIVLAAQDVRGLSGLARAPDGTLWTVGERDHVLLALSETDGRTLSQRAIDGIEDGIDLESVAWLGNSKIAIGTERSADGRELDTIYIVDIASTGARVTSRLDLHYDLWGFASRGNQGIEGLCYDGSTLLAAVETPRTRHGKRVAAIGRYDMASGVWTALWLHLTSESGKLSALDCRAAGERLDVLAIERHFKVSRILRFSIPRAGDVAVIEPTIALDMVPFKRDKDNFEGVVWIDDASATLILDNDFGSISGPNTLIRASF